MRHQLPVSSPVGVGPIFRGVRAALTGRVAALEELALSLRERFSAAEVRLTASGTDALRLAFERLSSADRVGEGEPVVALPAYSCFDLVTAAVGARVRVTFYDVDPTSLTPDPNSLERVLSRGASIAVVGNLYGYPIDWDEVRRLSGQYGTFVIEDAAQGVGTAWRGVEGGGFGDATVLSFGRGKGWTGGGGGALLWRTNADSLPLDSRAIRLSPASAGARPLLGTVAQWAMGRPWLYGIPASIPALGLGETVYKEPSAPGAMPPSVAGVVAATEAPALSVIPTRRVNAHRWEDLSTRTEQWVGCVPLSEGESSYLRYAAVARDPATAARLARLLRPAGVVRGYPCSLASLPQVRGHVVQEDSPTPGADVLAGRVITFATHPAVAESDFARVARALE